MNKCQTCHQPGVLRVLQAKGETRAFNGKTATAKVHDFLAKRLKGSVHKAGLEMASVQTGQKVLVIGFGTGHCPSELTRSVGSSGTILGIDLSEKMVEISRNNAEKEGLNKRIELLHGDALHLSYAADTLDGIFMSFVLEILDAPEIAIVLSECKRILRPGGRLAVVSMSRLHTNALAMKVLEWMHRHFPNYFNCRPILVRQALEDAGFEIHDFKVMKRWISVEVVCGIKGTAMHPSASQATTAGKPMPISR